MDGQKSYLCSSSNWKRVKVLGKGSHGVVFLAIPIKGPFRHVAVKVAPLEQSSSLVKEKHILQNFIGCPEIVQCIGSEVSIDGVCSLYASYNLVMECAPGGTLANLLTCRGKLPESEGKGYLRMLLRGLSSIHGKGFVHGDLKPANILVFPEYGDKLQLKIAGFGLSGSCKEFDEERLLDGNVFPKFRGTPRYMSPVSVFYGKINAQLDIWSLGCILIEMVSGKPVWSNCKNDEELMAKMIEHYMEYPEIPEELSEEGKDFLVECCKQHYKDSWTAEMLLQHPYVKEEQGVDDAYLIWNLPNSVEEILEVDHNNLAAGNHGFCEEYEDLKEDDPLYDIAKRIGFDDLLM